MKKRRSARAAILALIIAGCGEQGVVQDEPAAVQGNISGRWSDDHAPLRVAYGKRWAVGDDVAADAAGAFRVPPSAQAVVAYVDSNRNGRFDRYAEPSGDCELVARRWTCSLVLRRTTVQRSISVRNGQRGDQTLVFWEDFQANGARILSTQVCLEDRCTHDEASPFLSSSSAEVRVFSLCGEEGFPDQEATIRGSSEAAVVPISHPGALEVSIRSDRRQQPEGELLLHVQGPPFDRLLVWAATLSPDSGAVKYVHWTSETAAIRMTDTPTGVELRIPSALRRVCQQDPACEIAVQVLKYWSAPGAALVSATEYRSTVNFRGQP